MKGLFTNRTIQFSKSSRRLYTPKILLKPARFVSRLGDKKPDRRIFYFSTRLVRFEFRLSLILTNFRTICQPAFRRPSQPFTAKGRTEYQTSESRARVFLIFFGRLQKCKIPYVIRPIPARAPSNHPRPAPNNVPARAKKSCELRPRNTSSSPSAKSQRFSRNKMICGGIGTSSLVGKFRAREQTQAYPLQFHPPASRRSAGAQTSPAVSPRVRATALATPPASPRFPPMPALAIFPNSFSQPFQNGASPAQGQPSKRENGSRSSRALTERRFPNLHVQRFFSPAAAKAP